MFLRYEGRGVGSGGSRRTDRTGATTGGRGFWSLPSTALGRWAVYLAVAFIVLWVINSLVFMTTSFADEEWRELVLPFYGIGMLAIGFAAGVVGVIAVIRKRERSWVVWFTILPMLLVAMFVLGEIFLPH